ncbi:FMN-dependent NADH-azoreductase [Nonomuraea sp. NPDC049269]|uniref:FMN-dependent NADH-azoreductase n=1 Tax=Nonomuraea sp. NPDC049269 TaxID=3364349 RepID=UPI00371E3950
MAICRDNSPTNCGDRCGQGCVRLPARSRPVVSAPGPQRTLSCSRAVTDTFRRTWQEHHPEGTVIYRDLTANPIPHLTADAHTAGQSDPASHSLAQAAAFAQRLTLIEELENADAVLIGAPMYNYSIPSTLKAWLDSIVLVGRTAATEDSAVRDSSVRSLTSARTRRRRVQGQGRRSPIRRVRSGR